MSSLAPLAAACPGCGTEVAANLKACPMCHRLVHGEALKRLAAEAEQHTTGGDARAAVTAWRSALDLLPPGSSQHAAVMQKVAALSPQLTASEEPHRPSFTKRAGVIGVAALLLWKFKFVLVFLLTKAKVLLLGLGNMTTAFTMLLSFGVYWTAWGWMFALGLVLSIYVHEMGHVIALRRFGIPSSAPMFVPGLGALVRLNQHPATRSDDARVGLAGPIYGLGAAVACYSVFLVTGAPLWAALARTGAWINLFNLMPVWQLDGGRGFGALTRSQRFQAAGVLGVIWAATRESMLILLFVFAAVSAFRSGDAPDQPDAVAFWQYVLLAAVLALMCLIPVRI